MTTSTSVERRRLRARLALTLSTILCSGLAAPAFASSPHPNPDANGVDLTDGTFNPRLPIASIGSGQAELALVATPIQGYAGLDNWSNVDLDRSVSGGVTYVTVRLGASSDSFSSADGFATSRSGTGATITLNGDSAVYRTLDGVTISFANPNPQFAGGTSNFCSDTTTANCHLLPTAIDGKSGMTIYYDWDVQPNCIEAQVPDTGGTCNEYWRLRGVSNDAGYGIAWTYVNETGSPVAAYFRQASATFSNANVAGASPVATYGYPSAGVTTITTPGGRTWRITAPSGPITGIRRPGASADSLTASYSGGVLTAVTSNGVTTTYARSVSGTTATMVVSDPQSHTTTVVSDMTRFRPTSVTDALGRTTTMSYDGVGRLTEIAYPEGNARQFAYDAASRTTSVTLKAKPGSGLADIVTSTGFPASCDDATCASWSKDALGNQTDYTYDAATGLLASVTAPAPTSGATRPQTRYSYTTVAGIAMVTEVSACRAGTAPACVGTADEVRTTVAYDGNLNATSITTGAGDASLTATTTAGYDGSGNLLTVDGPLAGSADTTTYRWSTDRQPAGVISPDPDGTGPLKRRATYLTYDGAGRLLFSALGTVTGTDDTAWANFAEVSHRYTPYGANGQVERQVLWTPAAGDYQITDYLYDAVGRPVCSVFYMNGSGLGPQATTCAPSQTGGPAGPDRVTKTTYDAAGEPTKVQSAYGTADQSDDASATYNANGTLQTLTDANGNRTTYEYDGFDRLSKTRLPSTTTGAGSSSTTDYEQLGYDAAGNVTSRRLRDAQMVYYSYDALGRRSYDDHPNAPGQVDATYTYDNLGQVLRVEDQKGFFAAFVYDALGRAVRQSSSTSQTDLGYDLASRLVSETWADGFRADYEHLVTGEVSVVRENGATVGVGVLAAYAYDDLGRRSAVVRGNGTTTSYGYDAASRLTSLSHDVAGTAYDVTFGYGYNPAGQIVSRTVSNDAYAWAGSSNRNDASDVNGLNQATHVGGATLGYDGRGNLTRDGGAATLRYNTRDELLVNGLGDYINYDPVGQLAQLYIGGHYTNLHNAAGALAVEYDGSTNAVARRYVDGPGTDEPIVWYEGAGTGDRRFLLADERGSVVAVSDGSGAVTAVNTYDEYGVPGSGNVGRFQYTGQKWLAGLGLYDYKARMYAPGLGRFLQPDPIGYGDGMNWYGYVGGDPVNATDPEGLFPTDIVVTMPRKSKKPPPPPVAAAAGLVFSHNGISGFGSQAGPLDDVLEDDIIVTAVRAPKAGSRVGRLPQNGTPHNYVIGPLLSPCPVSSVMNYLKQPGHSAPGAPAAQEGTHNLNLTGNNPISQYVNSSSGTIINTTLPPHMFYPGSVTIQVTALSPQTSTVTITGTGTGKDPGLNDFIGKGFFGGQAAGALDACGR